MGRHTARQREGGQCTGDAGVTITAATSATDRADTGSAPTMRRQQPGSARAGLTEQRSLTVSNDESQTNGQALSRFLRRHGLFCFLLTAATIVRVVATLAYPPALFTSDSLRYVTLATHLTAYPIQPVGYPVMLMSLLPLHSLALVICIQHCMGIATGTLVYALLRHRFSFPSWAATLAALPPLLSAYAIQIEHFLLSDTLFGLLVTVAIVLLLWRPFPSVRVCALVGLLLAASVLVRSQGAVLAIPAAAYLGARFAGIRAIKRAIACVLALGITLVLPVLGYASWFDSQNGEFQLTTSTGAYLYGRVSTFADCSIIKPPADERWLCLSVPVSKRQYPGFYVWDPSSPLVANAPAWDFSPRTDRLATNFDLRAIEAQPLAYLSAVWHTTFESFSVHRGPGSGQSQTWYSFSATTPQSVPSLAAATAYSDKAVFAYNHGNPSTRIVPPYATWILDYQRFVVVPGPLLGLLVIIGVMGMAVAWRRFGGAASLPWLAGITLIVTPAATADFDARYLVSSIPLFCLAAGLGLKEVCDYFRTRQAHPEKNIVSAGSAGIYLADY